MKTNLESPPSDILLLQAIKLKTAVNYPHLARNNKKGGKQSPKWWLCHSYSLKELLLEATKRNLL